MKIEIDWSALDELQDWSYGWRAAIAPDLSNVYVPGEGGNPQVMIIGEAPGAQEEIKKRPFVGPAGIVLRELMSMAGLYTGGTPELGQANCWLTNVVKFRPPRNRTPYFPEIQVARFGLLEEWKAIRKPLIIVPVGAVALQAVMGRQISILRVSGKPIIVKSRTTWGMQMAVWPMIHPAYGLRNVSAQDRIEQHWEIFAEWLRNREHGAKGN